MTPEMRKFIEEAKAAGVTRCPIRDIEADGPVSGRFQSRHARGSESRRRGVARDRAEAQEDAPEA